MVRIALDTVAKGPGRPEEAFLLRVALLPLRLNIDQQAIAFVQRCVAFAACGGEEEEETGGEASKEEGGASADGLGVQDEEGGEEDEVDETSVWVPVFRAIDVRALKLKLDYWPNKVDYERLRAGALHEVVNLFAYEGLEVAVRRVRATHLRGSEELVDAIIMSWMEQVLTTRNSPGTASVRVSVSVSVRELLETHPGQLSKIRAYNPAAARISYLSLSRSLACERAGT